MRSIRFTFFKKKTNFLVNTILLIYNPLREVLFLLKAKKECVKKKAFKLLTFPTVEKGKAFGSLF